MEAGLMCVYRAKDCFDLLRIELVRVTVLGSMPCKSFLSPAWAECR